MTDPEADLVARAKRADRAALELLCCRHLTGVWRYAWFRTHSRESAAEIVQETFLRVTRYVAGFDGRSTFGTWLFTLARSVSIEFARRERLRRRLDAEQRIIRFSAAVAAQPLHAAGAARASHGTAAGQASDSRDADREAVRDAVAELPGPQRDAIVLCELSEMTIADAAAVLGWTQGRVKSTLFRARRRLRDRLKDCVSDEAVRAAGASPRTSDAGP